MASQEKVTWRVTVRREVEYEDGEESCIAAGLEIDDEDLRRSAFIPPDGRLGMMAREAFVQILDHLAAEAAS